MSDITAEYKQAVRDRRDTWVPACGGTETPFAARNGQRLLYCFNPALQRHAYLDLNQDLVLSDEEANAAMGRAA